MSVRRLKALVGKKNCLELQAQKEATRVCGNDTVGDVNPHEFHEVDQGVVVEEYDGLDSAEGTVLGEDVGE